MFDLRWLIGGLFTVYGVLLTVVGLFDSHAAVAKAQGVRINIWVGLGMLVLGLLFLLWRWLSLDNDRRQRTGNDASTRPEGLQEHTER